MLRYGSTKCNGVVAVKYNARGAEKLRTIYGIQIIRTLSRETTADFCSVHIHVIKFVVR